MDKIASKQIDGVVDLASVQSISGRKQFNGGVGSGAGPSGHYPLLWGGYLYWVASPAGSVAENDYRMGVSPSSGVFVIQKLTAGVWTNVCPEGCTSTSTATGGSGGGCLAYGTQVLLGDGSLKAVEALLIGEEVTSVALAGLDSAQEDAWKTFSSPTFSPVPSVSRIIGIQQAEFDHCFLLNGTLKATFEHPLLVRRDGLHLFVRTKDLLTGDQLFHYQDGWVPLLSIQRLDGTIPVVNINVEAQDTYFADFFLVHNLTDAGNEKNLT
jgi:hypothetical protein